MNNEMEQALDWNSEISKESEFELLPEGIYDFTVESLERAYFEGSDKMGPCPQADITLAVQDPISKKSGKVFEKLFLHQKTEWKLSEFFTSIGQKRKGEPLRMNWAAVPGSGGRLELSVNRYTDRDGNKRENNRVKKYLPYERKAFTPGQF